MESFLSSWQLFAPGFLAGLSVSVLCGVAGVYVVLRRTVFLALALSQFASSGIAAALWFQGPLPGSPLADPDLMSLAAVLAGMGLLWLLGDRGALPPDAWLGGLTALAAGVSVLIVSQSAHGLDEVKNLLFADLLLVGRESCLVLAGFTVLVLGLVATCHRHFLLAGFDPDQATAMGLKPARWTLLMDLLAGAILALTIRAAGSLVVFGLLVIPPMAALGPARRMKGALAWSAGTALAGTAAGMALSVLRDWPAGPAIVVCVGTSALSVAGLRRWKQAV